MKISNSQAVSFINAVNRIKNKNIPIKLSFALRHNFNLIMNNQVKQYEEELKKLESQYSSIPGEPSENDMSEYSDAINCLLNEEIEHVLKTVSIDVFEMLDSNDRYDALSLTEFDAISFMLEE